MAACPMCKNPVEPGAGTAPFCSARCRLLDLGNWLDERYAVPGADDEIAAIDEPVDEFTVAVPDPAGRRARH